MTVVFELHPHGPDSRRIRPVQCHKVVRLAAQYDITLEWFHDGFKTPAVAIARALDIHDSTAREWIRVGHALDDLPLVHDAFATNALSYAKVRILTRWAHGNNEAELLELAHDRTANRLTTAIASYLASDETDDERDQRQHDNRSVTVYTDYDNCFWVEGEVAEDGVSIQVGGVEPGDEDFFNIRGPVFGSSPVEYDLARFEPAADGSGPVETFTLTWQCEEAVSAFDGSDRTCRDS